MSLSWLSDRSDPRVQEALKRTCGICKAPKDMECRSPFKSGAPLNRIIHLSRYEVALDPKGDKGDE
ncbi:hypothetical protein NIIDNTM18_42640 [Mycolicibacterium litorale]|uniref:Uncharacterized protein n=1 Tax=Mycolicibacterium litorale TaxID=758802 RepID=A0A6S6PAH1_9MYCO|nr:hypothetical protein NIIDNTM18_42640 [Mycolicibacterium litorale]